MDGYRTNLEHLNDELARLLDVILHHEDGSVYARNADASALNTKGTTFLIAKSKSSGERGSLPCSYQPGSGSSRARSSQAHPKRVALYPLLSSAFHLCLSVSA